MSDSVWPHWLYSARLFCPWDSPGKNTGVGCHALLQGMFLAQESPTSLTSPPLAYPLYKCIDTFVYTYIHTYTYICGFPDGSVGKESACKCRRHRRCGFDPWVGKVSWSRKWQPIAIMATHSNILAWKSLWTAEPGGLQSMDCKGLDTTEWLTFSFATHTHTFFSHLNVFFSGNTAYWSNPGHFFSGSQFSLFITITYSSLNSFNISMEDLGYSLHKINEILKNKNDYVKWKQPLYISMISAL